AVQRELNYVFDSEWSQCGLAGTFLEDGDLGQARAYLEEALAGAIRRAGPGGIAHLLHHFAILLVAERRFEAGALLLAATEARAGVPLTRSPRDQRNLVRALRTVRQELDADTLDAVWKAGLEVEPEEIPAEVFGWAPGGPYPAGHGGSQP
ncbi:MAG: hypothetical protein QOE58_2049, partial [Actinomycetota bacterium]|nr:hypothetical protein [Actinomycetota bacterium]